MSEPCECRVECCEGEPDGPGVCKELPMPPEPPLVELVVVDRFEGEAEATERKNDEN